MNTLIVILGPTGVGKTDVCLRVAEHFCIPIINADSRQLYREIPIGTYEQDVLQLLEKLWEDKRIALLSGGSMMYVDAVCNGIDDIPTVDDEIRVWMKERFASEGLDALCEELRQLDPDYYEIVDRKNYRRVIHALEIIHQSGKTYTSFRTQQTKERPFRILKIGLNRPREELYDRINRRVDQMVANGLVEEARRMYPHRENNALNTVGYKELFLAFDGKWTLDEAIERIKGNTRRYCRKQLTWYKRDTTIHWFSPDQVEDIIHLIHDNCPQAT